MSQFNRIARLSMCVFAAAMTLGLIGCNSMATLENRLTSAEQQTGGLWSIRVTSSAFETGKPIPTKYTADGDDVSPPLHWIGVPPETEELALIVEDPDAPGKHPAVHWMVYKIPYGFTGVNEGASTNPMLVEGTNSFGKIGYSGPKPPRGIVHHYYFQVYALDDRIDVPRGADVFALMDAIHEHVLAKGFLMGTYLRGKK